MSDAGAPAADGRGVGEAESAGVARRVLVDGEQARDPGPAHVLRPHQMARPLGRDHEDVDVLRRLDEAVVDREAVREGEVLARRHGLGHVARVDVGRDLVGHEHHHDVGLRGGPRRGQNLQPRLLGLGARGAPRLEPDGHVAARVFQVVRLREALAAVADDGDAPFAQRPQVCVPVVINLHLVFLLSRGGIGKRKSEAERGGTGAFIPPPVPRALDPGIRLRRSTAGRWRCSRCG
jgi:hypothetical protein